MALKNFYGQIYGAIKADFADRVSFQRQSEGGGGIVTEGGGGRKVEKVI